jgi:hypothetical protein
VEEGVRGVRPRATKRRQGVDFLVKGQPREVLARGEAHMLRQGFTVRAIASTETTRVFNAPAGALGLLDELAEGVLTHDATVQFVASAEGENHTLLTVTSARQKLQHRAEQVVIAELSGEPLDGETATPGISAEPVYKKRSMSTECLVFDDRVEMRSDSGASEVMRFSDIKEVRTGWGRLRASPRSSLRDTTAGSWK